MKITHILKKTVGLAALVLMGLAMQTNAADNLEGVVKETGWEGLIGEWEDPKGNINSFAWKYPGTVIESITRGPGFERVTLFFRNAKNGEVSVVSADSKGGHSKGSCVFSKGAADIDISAVQFNGKEGSYQIKYILDGDTLTVEVPAMEQKNVLKRK